MNRIPQASAAFCRAWARTPPTMRERHSCMPGLGFEYLCCSDDFPRSWAACYQDYPGWIFSEGRPQSRRLTGSKEAIRRKRWHRRRGVWAQPHRLGAIAALPARIRVKESCVARPVAICPHTRRLGPHSGEGHASQRQIGQDMAGELNKSSNVKRVH
jgi:hypothetical protein